MADTPDTPETPSAEQAKPAPRRRSPARKTSAPKKPRGGGKPPVTSSP